MKQGIHPNFVESTIKCACGNTFTSLSTKQEVNVGICSNCHPFFTGQQRYVAAEGRLERFQKRYAAKK